MYKSGLIIENQLFSVLSRRTITFIIRMYSTCISDINNVNMPINVFTFNVFCIM